MEAIPRDDETSPGTRWFSLAAAKSDATLDTTDQAALCSSLERINRYINEPDWDRLPDLLGLRSSSAGLKTKSNRLAYALLVGFNSLTPAPRLAS
jgi:hypothetical protein